MDAINKQFEYTILPVLNAVEHSDQSMITVGKKNQNTKFVN